MIIPWVSPDWILWPFLFGLGCESGVGVEELSPSWE